MNTSSLLPEGFSLRKLLFRNTGLQLASQAIAILVALATTFVLSRYLGVTRYGGLNYVFAFYYFFLTLGELGVDVVVIRECSQRPHEAGRIIGTMRTFKLILALLLMAVACGIITAAGYPAGLRIPLYCYALILPLISLELPGVIFQTKLNAKIPALLGLSKALANGLFLVALIASGLGMTGYVIAILFSEVIILGLIIYFSRRFVQPVWGLDADLLKKILKSSLPIAMTGVFIAIINRSDFIMLERMTDLKQVGLYSAVYKVTNLMESLPLTMMSTLYPVMSRYAHSEKWKLKGIYHKSLILFSALALPMGILVTLFSGVIIEILFGGGFRESAAGLRFLIWATVFLYPALIGGNILICLGREKINLGINIVAGILNVTLNFLWIPRYGFVGAAAATAAAYFFILACVLMAAGQSLNALEKNK